MTKKTFNVANMHCSACAMTLEGMEDELPGIKQVSASYHQQEMSVEYDETKVTVEQIVAAARELGYQASLVLPAA